MTNYFKYSQAKREAATRLPWTTGSQAQIRVYKVNGVDIFDRHGFAKEQDAAYIVHACNTLPKIEALLWEAMYALKIHWNDDAGRNKKFKEIEIELQKLVGET